MQILFRGSLAHGSYGVQQSGIVGVEFCPCLESDLVLCEIGLRDPIVNI